MREFYSGMVATMVVLMVCVCLDSGKVLASALLKLVKNVTEPTVIKYTLARMEELLPGMFAWYLQPDAGKSLSLECALLYTSRRSSPPQARRVLCGGGESRRCRAISAHDPQRHGLRAIRCEPLAGAFLDVRTADLFFQEVHAIVSDSIPTIVFCHSVRPRFEDVDALCQWSVSALKLGPGNSLNDPNRANVTRAAVSSMMVLLRHQKSRVVFVKQGGVAPYVDAGASCDAL